MADDPVRVTAQEIHAETEDRFHRLRLIGWWDQERLANARILVVGAGALGNEIVKNLALLGIGNILIADMDTIENSNLSRSVLYRETNNGQRKAEVAAQAARGIYPQMRAHHFIGNVVYDLGMGAFRWADVVLGGLDNREARLAINRNCYRVNRPWIDGAIEQIAGVARCFVPDGPCYECTMSEEDWALLRKRRSCNLLSREEMASGKTPTTPTISSVIAGVQCQEAVKLLHGMDTIAGKGWVFQGITSDSWLIEYQRKEECYSHDRLDEIVALDDSAGSMTARHLVETARKLLGPEAQIELGRDMLEKLVCPKCGDEEPLFTSPLRVTADKVFCPRCDKIRRDVRTFYRISGDESFADEPLSRIGVPPFDIIIARTAERSVGFELSADAPLVLGPLDAGTSGVSL